MIFNEIEDEEQVCWAIYKGKNYYGKEWLFEKLNNLMQTKSINNFNLILLVGNTGSGKTHLCCELKWPTNERIPTKSILTSCLFLNICKTNKINLNYLRNYFQKILKISIKTQQILIIIDGLDELFLRDDLRSTNIGMCLLDYLIDMSNNLPQWLCLTLTVRPSLEKIILEKTKSNYKVARILIEYNTITCNSSSSSSSSSIQSSQSDYCQESETCLSSGGEEFNYSNLKDIQVYILKRLDNEQELKNKFNKLNAIEMLNLLLIKSNNCILYVEKMLDLILLNVINSSEIRNVPVTLNGLYLFLIERLLQDLKSIANTENSSEKVNKNLLFSIFNVYLVELKELSVYKMYERLSCFYVHLNLKHFERIFECAREILFYKCIGNRHAKYVLFHTSFIQWLIDVKFCTRKYLSNLNEGHLIASLFYLKKIRALNTSYHVEENGQEKEKEEEEEEDEEDDIHNFKTHKKEFLLKKVKYHLNKTRNEMILHHHTNNNNNNNNNPLIITSNNCEDNGDYITNNNNNNNNNKSINEIKNESTTSTTTHSSSLILNMFDSGIDLNNDQSLTTTLNQLILKRDLNSFKLYVQKNKLNQNYDEALLQATKQNSYEMIDYLINKIKNLNLNYCDADGWTPLRYSSWIGNAKIVKCLLESGACVDACDVDGRSALRAAVFANHENIVRLLLKFNANLNKCDVNLTSVLQIACYMGHWNLVKYLVRKGANVNSCDVCNRSILITCIYTQNREESSCLEAMRLLIESGANLNYANAHNQTALILACKEQLFDVVMLLLGYDNCDLDVIDHDSHTAIMYATQLNNFSLVELLVQHNAATHILDKEGRSLLSIACSLHNSQQLIQLYMCKGLDEMHKDNFGWTPLHEASHAGHLTHVQLLLDFNTSINGNEQTQQQQQQQQQLIDTCDNDGKTSLYLACQEGHLDIVQYMCMRGASLEIKSHDGSTPFRIACLREHIQVCKYLIEFGNANINYVDADGRSTLYCLILSQKSLKIIEFLLVNNAQPNVKDLNGRSCLHIAAHVNRCEIVQLLLDYSHLKSAQLINDTDNEGRTSLLIASWNDNSIDVIKKLIERGAHVNHRDNQGATALSIASQKGNYQIVNELLLHGALLAVSSKNPIKIALQAGHHKVVSLLQNWALTQSPQITSKSFDTCFIRRAPTTDSLIMSSRVLDVPHKKALLNTSHSISYHSSKSFDTQVKTLAKRTSVADKSMEFNLNNCQTTMNKKTSLIKKLSFSKFIPRKIDRDLSSSSSFRQTTNTSYSSFDKQNDSLSSPFNTHTNNNNNRFMDKIRHKLKFLSLVSSSSFSQTSSCTSQQQKQQQDEEMQIRSIADTSSVLDNYNLTKNDHTDDTAFIFNRTSLNDFFNQRRSFKESTPSTPICKKKSFLFGHRQEQQHEQKKQSNHLTVASTSTLLKKETSI